ncbi:MAG: hypothetical protein ACLGI9_18110 [Thermoanaerobaculia bacterium]
MFREILDEPRSLESDHPEQALALYDRLARENSRFSLDILGAAVILPAAALFLSRALVPQYKPLALLVLGVLGFGIPFLIQSFRTGRLIPYAGGLVGTSLARFLTFILQGLLGVALGFLGGAFLLLMAELVLARGNPGSLPRGQQVAILVAGFLIALGLAFLPSPLSRRILASPEGFRVIAHRVAACAVVGALIWVWNRDFALQTIPFLMGAGLLAGLVTSRLEIDRPLGRAIRIGQVRCLVRLDRVREARFHLDLLTPPEGGIPDELAGDEMTSRALKTS